MALLYVRELVSPEPAQEKRAEIEAEGLVDETAKPFAKREHQSSNLMDGPNQRGRVFQAERRTSA